MKHLFRTLVFMMIVLIYSCASNSNVIGKYATRKYPDKFQFKKDSTFIYEYGSFELYMYSTGNWKKTNNNTIILSSKIKNVSVPWKMYMKDNQSSGIESKLSINVKVIGKLNLNDYMCRIFINDNLYKMKSCDSLSGIALSLSDSTIRLQFIRRPSGQDATSMVAEPLNIPKFGIKPEVRKTVVIDATVIDSFFYYRPFKSEVIKLGDSCIKLYDPKRKRYEKIPKIPESDNIFSRFKNE